MATYYIEEYEQQRDVIRVQNMFKNFVTLKEGNDHDMEIELNLLMAIELLKIDMNRDEAIRLVEEANQLFVKAYLV